jgi:hypothetical protein
VAGLIPLLMAIISIIVAVGLTALLSIEFGLSIFIVNMITGMGLALGIDYRKASIGGDSFEKTPLGEAMREAVGEATGYIVTQMRQVNWTGQVVDVQGSTVYLNAGEGAGIKVGDTLSIYTVTRELIDPATGQSLGREEKKLGELRVGRVDQKYAVGELVGEFQTRRGDLIKM